MDSRLGRVQWGAGKPRVRTSAANWRKPLQWNARPFAGCNECGHRGEPVKGNTGWHCSACGHVNLSPQRRRVFCASLADVFDNEVDPKWRWDLLALIHDAEAVDFLVLTKRIGNAANMIKDAILGLRSQGRVIRPWPWPNVWIGATICNQTEFDRDVPKLRDMPAAVRFLSIEPMLSPIYCGDAFDEEGRESGGPAGWIQTRERGIDWVICGGESGPNARPMHPGWARSLRDQCAAAGVPFLFKQNGEWASVSEVAGPGEHYKFPDGATVRRVGKKAAGRTLDGRTWSQFPEPRR